MRRANALWAFSANALAFTDVTQSLGDGSASVTLAPGDKLYCGADEWLAGLLLFIAKTPPSAAPAIVAEAYDAVSDAWITLPTRERFDHLATGYGVVAQGFDYTTTGIADWVVSPGLWTKRVAAAVSGFPENYPTPPELLGTPGPEYFFVRLRNADPSISLVIDRCLPSLYNTYATAEQVARFIGLEDFTEVSGPLLSAVRERIRTQEDILDDYMRKSFRLGQVLNERDVFNPFGQRLRQSPVIAVTKFGFWEGPTFTAFAQGRNQDFYVDNQSGMLYFARAGFGRGLQWGRMGNHFMRQPASTEISYVYGDDFDISPRRGVVREVVLKRVAAEVVFMQDWVAYFVSNPDAVTKPEKAREWREQADEAAQQLRGMLVR